MNVRTLCMRQFDRVYFLKEGMLDVCVHGWMTASRIRVRSRMREEICGLPLKMPLQTHAKGVLYLLSTRAYTKTKVFCLDPEF